MSFELVMGSLGALVGVLALLVVRVLLLDALQLVSESETHQALLWLLLWLVLSGEAVLIVWLTQKLC